MAVLVAILWGCVLGEQALIRRARLDNYRAMRQMRILRLKRHVEPAVQPLPQPPRGVPRATGQSFS